MDIIFHICLIVIIAGFFFIQKFSASQNPYIFVILLSVIGLILLSQSTTYIIEGFNTTAEYNYSTHIATSETFPIKTEFNFEWMLYLSYLIFFILGVVNLTTGENYGEYKRK